MEVSVFEKLEKGEKISWLGLDSFDSEPATIQFIAYLIKN